MTKKKKKDKTPRTSLPFQAARECLVCAAPEADQCCCRSLIEVNRGRALLNDSWKRIAQMLCVISCRTQRQPSWPHHILKDAAPPTSSPHTTDAEEGDWVASEWVHGTFDVCFLRQTTLWQERTDQNCSHQCYSETHSGIMKQKSALGASVLLQNMISICSPMPLSCLLEAFIINKALSAYLFNNYFHSLKVIS